MDLKEQIKEIINSKISRNDLFLIDVVISGTKGATKILILLDGDHGVDIDTCVEISRKVGAEMEEKEIFGDPYLLEVSSPGLDHPLKLARQYIKNIGRQIKIMLNDDSNRVGELLEVKEDKIRIKEQVKEKGKKPVNIENEIYFSDIKKTFVLVSFK
jgi:ribosome maturation factor RimP